MTTRTRTDRHDPPRPPTTTAPTTIALSTAQRSIVDAWSLDPSALRLDVPRLVEHYRAIGVDVVNVTPSYGRELIGVGLLDDPAPALVLLGGEPVPPELWTSLREHPRSSGYDLYGPTEFTINALGADLDTAATPCLGRPIARSRGYVLDTSLAEVAPGGTGELYLAGDGLARDYLGAPALTAERFVANPFGNDGARLYRTGDLVTHRLDGGIEYRGRNDAQLKIRGFRIELGEIEAVAEEHHAVRTACASVPGTTRREPPLTTLEGELCRIFGEVPGTPVTGRHDGFFDLGGHSLAAMRVVAVVADDLGVDVRVGTLMAAPSAAALAAAMRAPAAEAGLGPVLTLRAPSTAPTVFCVHPAGCFAWQFAPLLAHVPADTGLIGLQAVGLCGGTSAALTINALAGQYLARIRGIQPSGPYRLLGYSYGGNVAHEIAAQLTAAGEQVELLALVDPAPLGGGGERLGADEAAALRGEQAAFLASMASVDAVDADADRAEALVAIRASHGVLGDQVDDAIVEAIVQAHRSASALMGASTSPRTDVPTLLIASDLDGDPVEPWGDLLGSDVEVHLVPVSHDELVTPAQWARFGPVVARRLTGVS